MVFFSAVVGTDSGLQRAAHLSTVTTIAPAKLDRLCAQFNLVRRQANFKGFKQTFLSYLESVGLKKTEDLCLRLNMPVPNSSQKLRQPATRDQLNGPMPLPSPSGCQMAYAEDGALRIMTLCETGTLGGGGGSRQ